ncbi:hypothetical protein [Mycobacterium xenopi]|uniref:Restriction endonuclease domain-containing protein n=2 Tax=Mycobacterium xenopi TaxID=1789 RepID=A0AAD1H5E4_MYCXE|nr:hypothetical protein [Mycobacterium xenopi]EUA43489.1 hypothetical protein I552_8230 [Mycobacterium xenopi 3993]EUA56525.1 hypothetical protein I553_8573 [Mycobacterium xenopi 4042]EID12543.1 hypothetical protein MXEN_12356 [Mycobacterium xenopi RIVM700367]MDA3641045.1 hypothetical protein [Mycobacterium xenopi]MDA3656500.1 hypothetical protein [Mycobacterium xenopi]
MAGLAEFPRGLVTLEEWDALELGDARRWELVEGSILMTPRPRPLHQVVSKNLTRLLDERRPDSLVVLQEVEVVLREGTYQRVEATVGDWVRTKEPVALDFTLDQLTQP